MSETLWIALAVIAVLIVVALVVGLVRYRRRQISLSKPDTATPIDRSGGYTASSGITFAEAPTTTGLPGVGDDAAIPRDAPKRPIADVTLPEPPVVEAAPTTTEPERGASNPSPRRYPEPTPAPAVDEIEPAEGRMERLRGRLARSQSTLGRGLLGLLGAGDLDEDSWEEIEDTLLMADLGAAARSGGRPRCGEQIAAPVSRTARPSARAAAARGADRRAAPRPGPLRAALPHDGKPSVLLVVGVNGTGKTTTTGKLARVLVADGRTRGARRRRHLPRRRRRPVADLGCARRRRGRALAPRAPTPPPSPSTPSTQGIDDGVDACSIDTAGRLHTKTGLMDELGKVKRVVEKQAQVDEVLLVLDATTGQNGLTQARVFAEVVDITGVVLTKLDGTAKGGIVVRGAARTGRPGQAGRPRRGPRRPGAVRARRPSSTHCWADDVRPDSSPSVTP